MDPGWLNSTATLIGAVAALLGSIATLLSKLRQGNGKAENAKGTSRRWTVIVGILLLLFAVVVIGFRLFTETNQPLNVRLTATAWNAFNKGDFNGAIASADECIADFRADADKEEAALENSGVPVPPTGHTEAADKKIILNRGALNDAATCFFIKGESTNKVGRKSDAIEAYLQVARYKYSRVFDPSGDFFWSPSEAAEGRLSDLRN
jgi:hypothetical protein